MVATGSVAVEEEEEDLLNGRRPIVIMTCPLCPQVNFSGRLGVKMDGFVSTIKFIANSACACAEWDIRAPARGFFCSQEVGGFLFRMAMHFS